MYKLTKGQLALFVIAAVVGGTVTGIMQKSRQARSPKRAGFKAAPGARTPDLKAVESLYNSLKFRTVGPSGSAEADAELSYIERSEGNVLSSSVKGFTSGLSSTPPPVFVIVHRQRGDYVEVVTTSKDGIDRVSSTPVSKAGGILRLLGPSEIRRQDSPTYKLRFDNDTDHPMAVSFRKYECGLHASIDGVAGHLDVSDGGFKDKPMRLTKDQCVIVPPYNSAETSLIFKYDQAFTKRHVTSFNLWGTISVARADAKFYSTKFVGGLMHKLESEPMVVEFQ
ncbi:MAG TPA: hypothetical protein VGL56_21155 [Fimbriimonadaceae bacterium]|jgi:hypothetical protein